jgi:glycerol-3-phosphate dehydrogenase (NAD(P)+)
MSRIVVLGVGAWGTALALSLDRRGGHQVTLWAHALELADQINAAGENTPFLPGFPIPGTIAVTADDAAIAQAEIVLSVTPSEFLRGTIARLRPQVHSGQIILSATKGVEDHTFLRMTEVIAASLAEPGPAPLDVPPFDVPPLDLPGIDLPLPDLEEFRQPAPPHHPPSALHHPPGALKGTGFSPYIDQPEEKGASAPEGIPIGALSGPSFALEVAQGQPTTITVAFADPAVAAQIQREFSSETLRLYTSTDVIGVELGGALKNVIAIAAGVAAGVGLGYNSAAGLMTRGIAEITRLAVACGARRETLAGLSGIGDLVLTCTGTLSRNRTVGFELGHGRKLPEILASLGGKVAEGVLTTRAALGLARLHNIEMPIAEQMELILEAGKDPREAIKDLMLRPGRGEH